MHVAYFLHHRIDHLKVIDAMLDVYASLNPASLIGISTSIPFPRKKYRAQLGAWGLIGKIHITSGMSVEDVEAEVRSAFKKPMKESLSFSFTYLLSTGGGNKSLTIPATSSSYEWTSEQVAKLANTRGCIYIMALDELDLPSVDTDVSCLC